MKKEYPALDMNMLKQKQRKNISTKDALADVIPIDWGNEVASGKVKIYVTSLREADECAK